jgi:hypothetical protein
VSTVAPPSSAVPTVLPAPFTTPFLADRAPRRQRRSTPRCGSGGHPAGPFDVLAALPEEERTRSSVALSPADAGAIPLADGPGPWIGPVRVVGAGHMATGIVAAPRGTGRRRIGRSATSRMTTPRRHARLRGRSTATGTATRFERRCTRRDGCERRSGLTCVNDTSVDGDEPLECDWGSRCRGYASCQPDRVGQGLLRRDPEPLNQAGSGANVGGKATELAARLAEGCPWAPLLPDASGASVAQ